MFYLRFVPLREGQCCLDPFLTREERRVERRFSKDEPPKMEEGHRLLLPSRAVFSVKLCRWRGHSFPGIKEGRVSLSRTVAYGKVEYLVAADLR